MVEAQTSDTHYLLLSFPSVTFALSVFVAVVLFTKYGNRVDDWLAKTRSRRVFFAVPLLLFVPAVLIVLIDIIDLSEVIDGKLNLRDSVFLSFSTVLVVCYFWGQAHWWTHYDKWDDRLARANRRSKLEESLNTESKWQTEFVLVATQAIREVVGCKWRGIQEVAERLPQNAAVGVEDLKNALDPERQITAIIHALYNIVRVKLNQEHGARAILRIAYFQQVDGFFRPVETWDGVSADCVTSPLEKHKQKFCLDAVKDCLTVAAAYSESALMCPNAAEANNDRSSPFWFFEASLRHLQLNSFQFSPAKRKGLGDKLGIGNVFM